MTAIADPPRIQQPYDALMKANEVRRTRAELKRRIARRELTAAEVILDCPKGALGCTVAELLAAQPRWGTARSQRLLDRTGISEIKRIDSLTDRQKRLLAAELQVASAARARERAAAGS